MPVNVDLPSLGVAILEAKIVKWFKKEGEEVKKEEPIAEVETDKVTFEVVSPIDGVLLKQIYEVGDTAKVNEPLAVVGEPGEQLSELKEADKEPDKPVEKQEAGKPAVNRKNTRKKATPAAKAAAKQKGIDLETIEGSGPNGLITKEDVLKHAEAPQVINLKSSEEEIIPFDGVRKQIAERLSDSKNKAVHVTTVVEIDMTEVDHLRKMLKTSLLEKEGINLTFLPFVVRAALDGIKSFPIINSTLDEEKIIIKKYVNFGIAVESPKGLIVPVIHNSDKLSFWELVREINKMTSLAKENSLTPEYIGGGTITLSNAGSYGSVLSTPIIQQPQSALLWMGKIVKRPVVRDDEIVIRKMMNLCISYDHRIMDGAKVAQFLEKVRKNLENPGSLLIE